MYRPRPRRGRPLHGQGRRDRWLGGPSCRLHGRSRPVMEVLRSCSGCAAPCPRRAGGDHGVCEACIVRAPAARRRARACIGECRTVSRCTSTRATLCEGARRRVRRRADACHGCIDLRRGRTRACTGRASAMHERVIVCARVSCMGAPTCTPPRAPRERVLTGLEAVDVAVTRSRCASSCRYAGSERSRDRYGGLIVALIDVADGLSPLDRRCSGR